MPLALRLALAGATLAWWPRAGERGRGSGACYGHGDGDGDGYGDGSGNGFGNGFGNGDGAPHPIRWCSWT